MTEENSLESGDNVLQLEVVDRDGSQMENDRNTKKVRFKEGTAEADTNMTDELAPSPKISWKDKLLGTNPDVSREEEVNPGGGTNEDDIEFLEGDIQRSVVNGIPAIEFSERIQQILFKEMELTVVVKLLGRNIGYGALSNRINGLWSPSKPFHLIDIENGYYLAKFQSIDDYSKVLTQGPWLVYGQYLTVQPWTKEFTPLQPYPSVVLAWIRLPGLPGFLYKKKILEEIGKTIGKVVRLDLNTDSRTRGRFARMAVYINLDKPLTGQVLVNGMKQKVEYEALPTICFSCGKYGHTKELCQLAQTALSPGKAQSTVILTETEGNGETENFGPWMVVERKSRNLRNKNIPKSDNKGKGIAGNRFEALTAMGNNGGLETEDNNKDEEEIAKIRVNAKVGPHEMKKKQVFRERVRSINFSQLGDENINSGEMGNILINSKRLITFNGKADQSNIKKASGSGASGPPFPKELSCPPSVAHARNVAGPSTPIVNSSNFEKGSTLSQPTIPLLISNSSNITAASLGNNGILSLIQNSCTNTNYDFQVSSANGGQVMADFSGTSMPSMPEAKSGVPIIDLNSNKHTAVSFKEKGPVDGAIKNRSSGKSMGSKEGSFRVTRKIVKSPHGKGNNLKIRNSSKVPLKESLSELAKSASNPQRTVSDASDNNSGPSYTWQRGNTSERLDRALANDDWISAFPHSLVYHLPRIKSDHRPILLKTNPELSAPRGRPFRFLAGWTKHANFKDLVSNRWRYSGNMAETLSNFTSYAKEWNRSTYGYIGTRKKQLLKSLGTIQKALDQSNSRRLANLEMEVRDELESVLNHEELLWRQKARCDWLQFGDRNTKFFHNRTMQRRKFNRIMAIRISDGEWCSEQETLREEAVKFFEDLYGECSEPISDIPSNIFPSLKEQDIDFLKKPILNDEIKKALFDMAPLKAPGSDGYHAIFFQSQWDLVGGAVCEWVQGIFAGNKIEEELNNTLIVLIPKKDHPEDFSQFRPISLCSVLYKLVMKVIANRLKVVFPNFISPEQAGFIAGRNISDNVIIAQEVIHSMRSRKTGKNWMAIKLDLEKAYDRISWEFIHVSLVAAGIPESLRKVIMNAISSSTMQILWNGVPSRPFKPVRGIRQGCPLSPYLFVLCMEWLGNCIRHEMGKGRWQPIRLARSGPDLSHLFFADDLVIFGKAEMSQAQTLKDILRRFCNLSGHRISSRKSNIFFSKGVDTILEDQISQFFGFQKVLNLGKYLGVPLLHDRVTKSTLNFVIDKVRSKLQNWDARKLSLAGRITLAQSVLLTIPSYFMQSLVIPKGVCDEIERITRQFIWGGSIGKSKPALIGWESICQPKTSGGLGFRYLHDHNTSFLMKIGFNLVTRKDDLWVRVLRSKYGWKSQLPESIHRSQCSHLWRSLSKAWPLLSENLLWFVGNGETIRGWKDNWIPKVGPLLSYVPAYSRLNMDSTLKDWVLQEGCWNIDMLKIWLPEDIIKRILSIPPPHPAEGEDKIIWARTESGSFTIRSAYRSIKENTWRPKDENWKNIWKYQGPQRVRTFLWLVASQRILTNSERFRRGFGQSSACSRCGHDLEDIMHALRDCPTAKEAWLLVVPPNKQSRFFSDSMQNWLSFNLSCHIKLQDKGITWSCLFGILAWRLWKNRNLLIFQNIDWTPLELIKSSLSWAQNFEAFTTRPKLNDNSPEQLQHCSNNWVFLYSDGAVERDSENGAAGGVVRDRDGNWVVGYTHYLGKCSPLEAELWSILDGVFILINRGYKKIKIRSDNLEVVRILSTKDMADSGSTLIRRIKRLLLSGNQWEIKHIPRENNLTADQMAKIGLHWKNSLRTFEAPPNMVATIFQHDKAFNAS
ncbi:reverse transcriptase [Gossypium australe]|uniref:Reverse transcriptase n=1 Tax=Gossypium australe TaxID=47621 RepID=A0A5B6UTQ5_9ROSI|nr:reverse transcriptase [Gossypium australe]